MLAVLKRFPLLRKDSEYCNSGKKAGCVFYRLRLNTNTLFSLSEAMQLLHEVWQWLQVHTNIRQKFRYALQKTQILPDCDYRGYAHRQQLFRLAFTKILLCFVKNRAIFSRSQTIGPLSKIRHLQQVSLCTKYFFFSNNTVSCLASWEATV